jgi:circadian clock protein KaiC
MPPLPHAAHASEDQLNELASTGISGLDHILGGGLTRNRFYLVEGMPGAGKTTLALQFLLEGTRLGETVLYVALSESEEELRSVAESHGWSLDGMHILEMVSPEQALDPQEQLTVFYPSEVELSETSRTILNEVARLKPTRVVFDSLSELRLVAGQPLQYRRQVLALKQYFAGQRCTVLVLDDTDHELQVQSIAHAVIRLEQLYPEYGGERRRVRLVKYRGVAFRSGYHDFVIRRGGLQVFPRVVAADTRRSDAHLRMPSGVPALDALLGGGLETGTSTLITGAAGSGKSSLSTLFVHSALAQGRNAAMFIFDESESTLVARARGLGIELAPYLENGRLLLQQVDPAELSPGEFAHRMAQAAQTHEAAIIVVDSLNGYLNAMPEERFLIIQLHELLTFLGQRGVATVLVGVQPGLIGGPVTTPVDASYLADAVILLRYFEATGQVHQAISVMKKRGGDHERTIREFRLQPGGIHVGEPLREFRGVLSGQPVYDGSAVTSLELARS